MRYYSAPEKKALDAQIAERNKLIEAQKELVVPFDAVEHVGPPEEIETSFGLAIITEGNVLLTSERQTVIVPKAALDNPEQWLPAEDET